MLQKASAAEPRKPSVKAPLTNAALPRAVAEMREAILTAVRSGQISELKTALDLNEMRPDVSDPPVDDPIAHLRTLSKDGEGKEILAILETLLETRPTIIPLGRDIENNAVYVWPYLAERDLGALSADETADLIRLVSPDDVTAIKAAKRWIWWRLAIGADGTWHSFRREK